MGNSATSGEGERPPDLVAETNGADSVGGEEVNHDTATNNDETNAGNADVAKGEASDDVVNNSGDRDSPPVTSGDSGDKDINNLIQENGAAAQDASQSNENQGEDHGKKEDEKDGEKQNEKLAMLAGEESPFERNGVIEHYRWVADAERSQCAYCKIEFGSIWNRRHHCRRCGDIFCDDCTNQRCLVPLDEILSPPNGFTLLDDKIAHRVCKACALRPVAIAVQQPLSPGNAAGAASVDTKTASAVPVLTCIDVPPEEQCVSFNFRLPPFSETHRNILVSLPDGSELRFQLPQDAKSGDDVVAMVPTSKIPSAHSKDRDGLTGKQKDDLKSPVSLLSSEPSSFVRRCSNCETENSSAAPLCWQCNSKLPSFPKSPTADSSAVSSSGKKVPETHVLELEFGVSTKKCLVRIPADYREGDEVFFALIDNKMWTVLCPLNSVGGSKILVSLPDYSKKKVQQSSASSKDANSPGKSKRRQSSLSSKKSLKSSSVDSTAAAMRTHSGSEHKMVSSDVGAGSDMLSATKRRSRTGVTVTPVAESRRRNSDRSVDPYNTGNEFVVGDTPLTTDAPKVIVSKDMFDLDSSNMRGAGSARKQLLPALVASFDEDDDNEDKSGYRRRYDQYSDVEESKGEVFVRHDKENKSSKGSATADSPDSVIQTTTPSS
jgi:hypothetical protein